MTAAPFPRHSYLRLVPPEPPRRRLSVRIAVADGLALLGRSRVFRLSNRNLQELIAVAMRMERRA